MYHIFNPIAYKMSPRIAVKQYSNLIRTSLENNNKLSSAVLAEATSFAVFRVSCESSNSCFVSPRFARLEKSQTFVFHGGDLSKFGFYDFSLFCMRASMIHITCWYIVV
jgi:hypothetical protein